MKGSEIITEILIIQGIKVIFGYPGGYVLDIYEQLRLKQDKITHYLTACEQSAVFAADGYARAGKDVGVVLTTSGPGATNIVTGLACANMDSIPIVAITGNVPTHKLGTDAFQEVDIAGIVMPVSKYSHVVKSIEELPTALISAFDIARKGRKGAVLIDIPQDIQQAELNISHDDLVKLAHTNKPNRQIDITELRRGAQTINNSSKSVVLCGGGILLSNAEEETQRFVKSLNCPVVTTLMGVAAYPNNDYRYMGLTGLYGVPVAQAAVKLADTIITLGARFGDRLTRADRFDSKRIVQIDIDRAEHDKNISGVDFIEGDIGQILTALTPLVETKDDCFIRELERYRIKHGSGDNLRSLHNLLKFLSTITTKNSVIATDVGEHQMLVARHYPFNGSFLTSGGLGAMGYGLGAIIGGILAKNADLGILITGDGSFNMEFQEIHTAVKHNLPLIIIIINNCSLGMVRTAQENNYGGEYMSSLETSIDYPALAKSMGAYGESASNVARVKQILGAYAYDKPIIIDYKI